MEGTSVSKSINHRLLAINVLLFPNISHSKCIVPYKQVTEFESCHMIDMRMCGHLFRITRIFSAPTVMCAEPKRAG